MIVVFGSINVDLVVPVKTLPRPGETVLGPGYKLVAGGKGANQALAAARAGAMTRMVGAVGRDAFAEIALADMTAAGVDLSAVARRGPATGCAVICVDKAGQNMIAVASGANMKLKESQLPDGFLGSRTLITMQMEVPHEQNWELAARARSLGTRLLLNVAPAGSLPGLIMPAYDWLVMNEVEVAMIASEHGLPSGDARAAGAALAEMADTTVVVTLGAQGAIAFSGKQGWEIGTLPVKPVDTTGAGDAFVGAFAAALDEGADLPTALRWGSTAGALACLTAGAQPSLPLRADIEIRMGDLAPAAKIKKGRS
ncbi:MAG TPA: ribokinase [Dongiaceae bacterium]|jgi:ribokinase|nr:ribokinase [Dongiaceae bacterium]